ncbi:MAG: hypothetical protein U0Y10_04980 [Spirosomataceae bacterium]
MSVSVAFAQKDPFQLVLPDKPDWNVIEEGKTLAFTLNAIGGSGQIAHYSLLDGKMEGMSLDSTGHFVWTPPFSIAERIAGYRIVPIVVEVRNDVNERSSRTLELKVLHVNRPPTVGELRPCYIQYNTQNTCQIDPNIVFDEDKDPLVFIPIAEHMPEGAKLSPQGELIWRPSITQFNRLKNSPIWVEFLVEDQPAKTRSRGRIKIEATQMDLPPEISIVPSVRYIKTREDATINLVFYLTDPNGESDIESFGFISDNPNIPKSALKKNTDSQYEFIWKPGYDFVKDPLDSLTSTLTFFVIDKAQKRDEKRLNLTILNTVNEREKDMQLYNMYRTGLVRAWELIEQLNEKQEFLKETYNQAKRGKKNRSILNAGLGAITGLSPVVIQTTSTSKLVSTIGGTTVLTVGTLEATEVIGKSIKDLIDRLNYVIAKRNELQTKGDIFARKYNLKSARRKPDFQRDLDDFVAAMNLSGLVALELDAGWNDKNKPSDTKLAKMFKDYQSFEEAQ